MSTAVEMKPEEITVAGRTFHCKRLTQAFRKEVENEVQRLHREFWIPLIGELDAQSRTMTPEVRKVAIERVVDNLWAGAMVTDSQAATYLNTMRGTAHTFWALVRDEYSEEFPTLDAALEFIGQEPAAQVHAAVDVPSLGPIKSFANA